jgi:hypothetical protein
MNKATLCFYIILSVSEAIAQDKQWTESDRAYLLNNLTRSRDELTRETEHLSEKQWKFKESPDRWSINEVVEHLAIYELLFDREIGQSLARGPQPELAKTAKPDSTFLNFIMEKKPHVTVEYTKPFTYASPMGLNDLKNNLAWFLKMRNESIEFVKTTNQDLLQYSLRPDRPNVHQVYIWAFGHVDRALRQIKKIKQHNNYPK